jgi:putative membrane protein (TIGR04086 family)
MVKKIKGRAPSLWKSVLSGLMLGAGWTLLCAMIIAELVNREVLAMKDIGYGSMAAILVGVFAGASLAGRQAGHMVIPAAALSGVAYFVCLLLVNVLFFGGCYTGVGVTLVLVLLASGAAVLILGKGRGGSKSVRYKIPKK